MMSISCFIKCVFSKKKSIDQITSLSTPAEIYAYIDKHIEK